MNPETFPELEKKVAPGDHEPLREGAVAPEEHESGVSPGIEFYVTDHGVRHTEVPLQDLKRMYAEMVEHGVTAVRFDWDWKDVSPQPGETNRSMIGRYREAMQAMQEAGMDEPTLIISSPPDWAMGLYKTDREAFFAAFQNYVEGVSGILEQSGAKVHAAQLFNEVNHAFLFKYVDIGDLPRAARITRAALQRAQPDIKLSTSLIASNTNDLMNKTKGLPDTAGFLDEHEKMLRENFDIISVDYYPGVWHVPLKEAGYKPKDMYKQLGMLETVLEKIAGWEKEYEIGEVGFPTNVPYSTEKNQRFFYDSFFRAFRQMIVGFGERGVALPKRVGLYETQDEANVSFGGFLEKALRSKVVQQLSRILPNPEHDFGLTDEHGIRKEILRGGRHEPRERFIGLHLDEPPERSQLKKIVDYVNRPLLKRREG
jgi:hypothetical protein